MAYESVRERFEEKFTPEPNSGCWLWTAVVGRNGYGRFWRDGRQRQAHRVSYEIHVGVVPDGLVLDHLCRVRCCVNPAHLEPVSVRENCRRGETGKVTGARTLTKTHCPNGHPYSGDNLIVTKKQRFCRACHRAHGRRRWQRKKIAMLSARENTHGI